MNSQDIKKFNLPDAPGVYLFKKSNDILYIGKATSLKDRVKSYFSNDLMETRGPLVLDMVFKADKIDFIKTDSVLEALILESELIKKNQPKYNTKEKDDRSYNFVVITDEDYPRVLIERGRNLEKIQDSRLKIKEKFGPFTNGSQLKEALKIVRKIFPFRDRCSVQTSKILNLKSNPRPCFNYQIGLCPGVCIGTISKNEYAKTIKNIELFFEGKKKIILKDLEKEMVFLAKKHEFEKAGEIKKTIFALNHIQDVALIKSENFSGKRSDLGERKIFRIEAYDIAHMGGKNTVGVMTVMENGKINKNEYRKFKINKSSQNDIAGLEEMLERRLTHEEWLFPQIIVVDGGKAQIKIAREVLQKIGQNIPVVSVVKDEHHRPKAVLGDRIIASKYSNDILLANSEAHRFAINYHKNLRRRSFLL